MDSLRLTLLASIISCDYHPVDAIQQRSFNYRGHQLTCLLVHCRNFKAILHHVPTGFEEGDGWGI